MDLIINIAIYAFIACLLITISQLREKKELQAKEITELKEKLLDYENKSAEVVVG